MFIHPLPSKIWDLGTNPWFVIRIDHLSTDDILKKWMSEFRSFMLKEEKELLGKDWEPLTLGCDSQGT